MLWDLAQDLMERSNGKMERSNRKLASGQILLAPFLSRKLRLRTRAKFSETAGEAPLYTTGSGFLKQPDKQKSAIFEADAGTAEVDFVARAETLAPLAAGWHFNRAAVAKDARAVFARIIAYAILG